MEATGEIKGRREKLIISLEHDGYEGTAVATVGCILQLLDGAIKSPGVHVMGHALDPERYMQDVKRMGMIVSRTAETLSLRS